VTTQESRKTTLKLITSNKGKEFAREYYQVSNTHISKWWKNEMELRCGDCKNTVKKAMPCDYLNEIATYEAACLELSYFDTLETEKLKLAREGSAKIAEDRRNYFYVPSDAT